jgi:hypothetical protein
MMSAKYIAGRMTETWPSVFLFISRQLVDSLPEDPFAAVLAIIADFRHALATVAGLPGDEAFQDRKRYQIAQEACALLSVYLKREGFAITPCQLPYGHDRPAQEQKEAVAQVIQFMNKLETDITAQQHANRSEYLQEAAAVALGPALLFEFSEEDLRRIWGLLSSLRDLVAVSSHLESAHRQRLLKRIDRLVVELGREIHDLSLFWGFVVEMSLVFRAPNKDAALLAPSMKELMQIVWSAQAKAFDRPPNTPCDCWGRTPDGRATVRRTE